MGFHAKLFHIFMYFSTQYATSEKDTLLCSIYLPSKKKVSSFNHLKKDIHFKYNHFYIKNGFINHAKGRFTSFQPHFLGKKILVFFLLFCKM
jgi:hypothetical protein